MSKEMRMTFTEHLGELRTRIVRSGIALLVAFLACYVFSDQLYNIVSAPLRGPAPIAAESAAPDEPESTDAAAVDTLIAPDTPATDAAEEDVIVDSPVAQVKWVALTPLEGFLVKFKLAGYGALVLAFPFILWQICAFIFPGLKPTERRLAQMVIGGCSLLAAAGVLTGYYMVFPFVLPYLSKWTPENVEVMFRMSETIKIIIIGLAGFGVAFQFPVVVLVLVFLGLVTPQDLKDFRKMAIIGFAFASAFLTPPDPISMVIMMLPLVVLYEISILLSHLVIRRRAASESI